MKHSSLTDDCNHQSGFIFVSISKSSANNKKPVARTATGFFYKISARNKITT